MALDGVFTHCLKNELKEALSNARVDKIYQPSKEELIFSFRHRGSVSEDVYGGAKRVYFSARANSPRACITTTSPENPLTPPMFCMLLRKHLIGGRFLDIRQDGLERALYFDFSCLTELGDIVTLTLAVEIMGRHSNIILMDEDKKVLDSIKRVPPDKSSLRPILPGVTYSPPPIIQEKLDISKVSSKDIFNKSKEENKNFSKALLNSAQGFSPIITREASYFVLGNDDKPAAEFSDAETETAINFLEKIKSIVLDSKKAAPYILYDKDKKPIEFSFMPITQYGLDASGEAISGFSKLLDEYYAKKDIIDRMSQQTQDVTKNLNNIISRTSRKLEKQKQELDKAEDRENLKIYGEIIYANIFFLEQGMKIAELDNFYSETGEKVKIPLDPRKTPAENAQEYFKKYRKAQSAEKFLTNQINIGKEDLDYLNSVSDSLSRSTTVSEVEEIKQELYESGFLRRKGKSKKQKSSPLSPHEYISEDGFRILVGRNNTHNDKLTLRTARKGDLWFHTKNIPGSHTIIITEGKEPSAKTIELAAMLAAMHSKAINSSNVPVDFVDVRHVKKPSGAKPGMVIYENNKTVFVTPDEDMAKKYERGNR